VNAVNVAGRLCINGVGMVTPVGTNAPASAAAMRAGISRLQELPWFEITHPDGETAPVIGAQVPALDEHVGEARLKAMLIQAANEALDVTSLDNSAPLSIYMALPSEDILETLGSSIKRLATSFHYLGQHYNLQGIVPVASGRAAGLTAIRRAISDFRKGSVANALVVAVDTLVVPSALSALQQSDRLREAPRFTGILPGEAAAAIVLQLNGNKTSGPNLPVIAVAGSEEEAAYGEPTHAEALANVLRYVGEKDNSNNRLVLSDLNGERYRALEWSLALGKSAWEYDSLRHWHAAESTGDTGAASGLIACANAVQAFMKGYARSTSCIVWGASDAGAREAILLGMTGRG
jgi:3-oxoacyl-[acyl-carrier-protein] synthase-1